MAVLRELIARIKLDAKAASDNLKKYDKLLDDTKKSTEDVTDETEKFGDQTEKTAKKAVRAGKKTANVWKRIGKSVKNAAKEAKGAGSAISAGLAVVTAATGAAAFGIFELTKNWAEATNEIGTRAGKLGVATKELQELQFIAKLTGAESEGVADALKEVQIRSAEAAITGIGAFADAAKILNLNLEDLSKKTPVELFEKLRIELGKVTDTSLQTFLAEELLGEQGVELGNIINLTEEDFRAFRKEAGELGGVLSKEAFKAAEDLGGELTRTGLVVESVKGSIAEDLAPTIQGIVKDFRDWLTENRELVKGKLVEFLNQVISAAKRIAPVLFKFLNFIIEINDATGGLINTFKLLAGAFVALKLAALGPIGAIAAGFVGLITLVDNYTERLKSAAQAQDKLADESGLSKSERKELAQTAKGRDVLGRLSDLQEVIDTQTSAADNIRAQNRLTGDEFSAEDDAEDRRILAQRKKDRDEAVKKKDRLLRIAKAQFEAQRSAAKDAADDVPVFGIAGLAGFIPERGFEVTGEAKVKQDAAAAKSRAGKKKKATAEKNATLGELLGFGEGGFDVPGTSTGKGLGTTLVNITFNIGIPSINMNIEAAPGATVRSQGQAAAEAVATIFPSVVKQTQRAAVGQIR